jgi:16S rRNA (uracil1498-N3)-methyltransferase
MRRLALDGDLSGRESLALDAKTSRYLLRVLRMQKGSSFPASDAAGHRFLCTIAEVTPSGLTLQLLHEAAPPAQEQEVAADHASGWPSLLLVQGLPKGSKMDLILRQAVELGADAVIPLQSRHCVVRESADLTADRQERRARIVKEALQQSGSAIRTRVLPTVSPERLDDALRDAGYASENSLRLLFHELPIAERTLHEYCAEGPRRVAILIGPEGGFAPEETELFRTMGFKIVHLEGAILRTETAATVALASVRTILMEKRAWTISL